MNTPTTTTPPAPEQGGLLGSYKIKTLLLTVGMLTVIYAGVVVLTAMRILTAEQFLGTLKEVIPWIGGGGALTILGRAIEGYAEKRDAPAGRGQILAGSIEKVEQVAAPLAPLGVLLLALVVGVTTACGGGAEAERIRAAAVADQPDYIAEQKACVAEAKARDGGHAYADACRCDVQRRHNCAQGCDACDGGAR